MRETNYYPAIEPYRTHQLAVDEIHSLYIEECGNPDGLPVIYVHGGPGFGCSADNRRFFDPAIYRIILFDQRGAGRSTPFADIRNNTTQDLIKDMERIRTYLKIDEWIIFGGSWGSTLSLVYAQTYPQHVSGFILRGVFLARQEDICWFFGGGGAKDIFPDRWQEFVSLIPEHERSQLLHAYYRRFTSEDVTIQLQAAKTWVSWQASCATLLKNTDLLKYVSSDRVVLSAAKLACHYYLNNCFLEHNQILKHMHLVRNKPCIIIHGRYDMIFNVKSAWDLHMAWPGSELEILESSGHAAIEPIMINALVAAAEKMRLLL